MLFSSQKIRLLVKANYFGVHETTLRPIDVTFAAATELDQRDRDPVGSLCIGHRLVDLAQHVYAQPGDGGACTSVCTR